MKMNKCKLKVLFAVYECAPFFKVGGLGDVAGSLPKALKKLGVDIRVVMPYYGPLKDKFPALKLIKEFSLALAGEKIKHQIFAGRLPASEVIVYFIGNRYLTVPEIHDGRSRFKFVLFCELASRLPEYIGWQPDICHANDWQTAIIIKAFPPSFYINNSRSVRGDRPKGEKHKNIKTIKTLFTIHNIGYQGKTELETLEKFGFKASDFSMVKEVKVNLMREAILAADMVSTVSPTYAREILTKQYGYDLAPVLRKRKNALFGIINGLDYAVFNPATDDNIARPYDINRLSAKSANKLALQKLCGFKPSLTTPLIGMISRLDKQKGFDILLEAFEKIMRLDLQLVLLGTGSQAYEKKFSALQNKHPRRFKAFIQFDLPLASRIYAGSDMFLMPSRYEPCGLGQLIAMKYGSLPIVRETGGLKDTVEKLKIKNFKLPAPNVDKATGFSFKNYSARDMFKAIEQAVAVCQRPEIFSRLQKNAMQADFSWAQSARKYLQIYLKLAKK